MNPAALGGLPDAQSGRSKQSSMHPQLRDLKHQRHRKYHHLHSKLRAKVNKFLLLTKKFMILDSDSSDDPVEERKAFIALKKEGEEDDLTRTFAAKTK